MKWLLVVYFIAFAVTLGFKLWRWRQEGKPVRKFFVGDGAAWTTVGSLFATWFIGAWLALNPFFEEQALNLPAMGLFGAASEVLAPKVVDFAVKAFSNVAIFKGEK